MDGVCAASPPAVNDPYRCVRLEWRNNGPPTYALGDTVLLDLYATADGCTMSSSSCPANHHPIRDINVVLTWDESVLGLKAPQAGDPNPMDPCDSANCAATCPSNTYNWTNSSFPNDCAIDALNVPCTTFPNNDGTALYASVSQTSCNSQVAPPACASPTGLHITTVKFVVNEVPAGGATQVTMLPCSGSLTKTRVKSDIPRPPGYANQDVTKSVGPALTIKLWTCDEDADCDDGDSSTSDTCASGYCLRGPATCNDGIACTVDSETGPGGTCEHIADDTNCDPTGSFCAAWVCRPPTCPGGVCTPAVSGCELDHACISDDGNPCVDPPTCQESTDSCGGCVQPVVTALGSRYLNVVPANQGSTPVAFLVTGDCDNTAAACVLSYIQSKCEGGSNNGQNCATDANCPKTCAGGLNSGAACSSDSQCPPLGVAKCVGRCVTGTVGPTPFYKTSAEWATFDVRGAQIRPDSQYFVHAECDLGSGATVLSAPGNATTWHWGDVDGDGDADGIDVTGLVNTFRHYAGSPAYEAANLWGKGATPCIPDNSGDVDAIDIAIGVDAFRGLAFPCAVTCP
jgi:hypothetical protein